MTDDLRVALVGYGLAGAIFHAPLIRATPGLRTVTVVTADSRRQAQAEQDLPGAMVVADAAQILEDPGRHDLVVVATANAAHAEYARAALEAGLAVVVEKPLASSTAEARELLELAQRLDGRLTVFHNRRWDGDLVTVQKLLAAGELGRPLRFESRFERWRRRPRPGSWRESSSVAAGGGLLLDLGSHVIDQALHLFRRPEAVYAEVRASRDGAAVDDDVFVALHHPRGVISHHWASAIASVPGPRLRVLGEAGGYEKYGLDVQEEALREGADPAAPGWGVEPAERWGRVVTEVGERRVETEPGEWPRFYSGVVEWLRSGAPPPVDPQGAVEVLEVIDAARESWATGSVVRLA